MLSTWKGSRRVGFGKMIFEIISKVRVLWFWGNERSLSEDRNITIHNKLHKKENILTYSKHKVILISGHCDI